MTSLEVTKFKNEFTNFWLEDPESLTDSVVLSLSRVDQQLINFDLISSLTEWINSTFQSSEARKSHLQGPHINFLNP